MIGAIAGCRYMHTQHFTIYLTYIYDPNSIITHDRKTPNGPLFPLFFLVLRFLAKSVSFLYSDKVAGGSVPGISTISTSLLAGYIMVHARMTVLEKIMHQGPYTPKYDFLAAARSRDNTESKLFTKKTHLGGSVWSAHGAWTACAARLLYYLSF